MFEDGDWDVWWDVFFGFDGGVVGKLMGYYWVVLRV